MALKLIAVAQSGLEVSAADIKKDALVPNLVRLKLNMGLIYTH